MAAEPIAELGRCLPSYSQVSLRLEGMRHPSRDRSTGTGRPSPVVRSARRAPEQAATGLPAVISSTVRAEAGLGPASSSITFSEAQVELVFGPPRALMAPGTWRCGRRRRARGTSPACRTGASGLAAGASGPGPAPVPHPRTAASTEQAEPAPCGKAASWNKPRFPKSVCLIGQDWPNSDNVLRHRRIPTGP